MAKNTPAFEDEIDLIELVRVFITHKTKYILLGFIGLTLGLIYTFQHEPRFETEFKIHVGHPVFTNKSLIYSSAVQEKLNASELKPRRLPHYSFNKKTELFSVISVTSDVSQFVTQMITDAMQQELIQLKEVAISFEGFDNKPVILNIFDNKPVILNNNNNILTWTNKDIAKLKLDQVLQTLKISFNEPKTLYPKPFKHGTIGLFVGLMAAFLWMLVVMLARQLRS